MNHDKALELVAALRSGEYKQTYGQLTNGEGAFCCLGVACLVAGAKFEGPVCNGETTVMPQGVRDYFEFHGDDGHVRNHYASNTEPLKLGENGERWWTLTGLNDSRQFTFDRIADIIEEKWEVL